MNKVLNGKSILLFIPNFFSYGQAIEKCYKELGAEATLYNERAVGSALSRAVMKIFPVLFRGKANSYYRNIIARHKNEKIDYILIVRCDMVSEKTLRLFKKTYRGAKLCLHLWDSLANIKGIRKKLKYFDFISSFDKNDCEKNKDFYFRPLFCMDDYNRESGEALSEEDIDIFFCGTIHSDRYKIISSIKNQCSRQGITYKGVHYLQSKFMYSYYKMLKKEFKKAEKDDFCFEATSSQELCETVKRSKAVLDIQHPKQTGLTMRTIEMLGMKKKIITTNDDIKNYDFYDSRNILIIDRDNPKIDTDFVNRPFQNIPDAIWRNYSLEKWANAVLGIGTSEVGYAK